MSSADMVPEFLVVYHRMFRNRFGRFDTTIEHPQHKASAETMWALSEKDVHTTIRAVQYRSRRAALSVCPLMVILFFVASGKA